MDNPDDQNFNQAQALEQSVLHLLEVPNQSKDGLYLVLLDGDLTGHSNFVVQLVIPGLWPTSDINCQTNSMICLFVSSYYAQIISCR